MHQKAIESISSACVNDGETLDEIGATFRHQNYLLCPHTAVGLRAAKKCLSSTQIGNSDVLVVSLATAHPAKFANTVEEATGLFIDLPDALNKLLWMETRVTHCESSVAVIKQLIQNRLKDKSGHQESDSLFAPFRVLVPASTANLGPGYDVLGMSLKKYLKVHVYPVTPSQADEENHMLIEFHGEGEVEVSKLKTDKNLLFISALKLASAKKVKLPPIRLVVQNDVPFGRGLGSSACAIVAGVLIANRLCSLEMSSKELVAAAAAIEGHPDNVAASLYGGLVASLMTETNDDGLSLLDKSRVVAVSYPVATSIKCVICVPDFQLSTADSRKVVPDKYSREDSIFNVQRMSMLLAGLHSGNPELISLGTEDKFHQPQRCSLMPWLQTCIQMGKSSSVKGLLAVCLSGAGSSLIALATSNFDTIGNLLSEQVRAHNVNCTTSLLDIDRTGSVVENICAL